MTTPPTAARLAEIRRHRATLTFTERELLAALDYVRDRLQSHFGLHSGDCGNPECVLAGQLVTYIGAAPPATAGDGERAG